MQCVACVKVVVRLNQGIPQSCSDVKFLFWVDSESCAFQAESILPTFSVDPMYSVRLSLNVFSFSSHHFNIHLTEKLHFVLYAVSQAALCGAVEGETLSLLSLKAYTWVTPRPWEIGMR